MNKIQITDKYWITSDSRSWQVSEYKGIVFNKTLKREQENWVNHSYHGTFEQAVKSLSQRLLREASRSSVSGLREEARQIEAILENAVKQAEIA